jgi:hypothetical protein
VDWSTRAAYRERLIDWVQLDRWQSPFAVTLTLRQCVTVPNGTTSVTQWLTDTAATQNMRHFLNKLDRSVFGKAAVRFGKRIGCVPVLEGGAGKRIHYHAVIDCPRPDLVGEFPALLSDAWRTTMWGYWQVDCQTNADNGWLTYITKVRDKPNLADAIDWTNLRLP